MVNAGGWRGVFLLCRVGVVLTDGFSRLSSRGQARRGKNGGGEEANKHESKKLRARRGPVGKTAVVGAKDRSSGQVATQVVERYR